MSCPTRKAATQGQLPKLKQVSCALRIISHTKEWRELDRELRHSASQMFANTGVEYTYERLYIRVHDGRVIGRHVLLGRRTIIKSRTKTKTRMLVRTIPSI
jgi:hypothetical protein